MRRKRFRFADRTLKLKLCGKKFLIEADEMAVEACKNIKREAKEYLKALDDAEKDPSEVVCEVCSFFEDAIDRLIYKGAAREIFGERPMTLPDLTELLCFIISELDGVISKSFGALSGEKRI